MTVEQKLTLIAAWFALISLIAVIVTVADKIKAKRGKWRVPEATLMGISVFGGSVAMLVTMIMIRHKTKHMKFMVGIPIVIASQIAAAIVVLKLTA